MPGKELLKIVVVIALAVVMFVAGFFFGTARERTNWQRTAVAHKAAKWKFDDNTKKWYLLWSPPQTPSTPMTP